MKVCISCQKDMEGKRAVPVKEDRIIRVIRTIKKTLGIAQMNELFVCEIDLEEHVQRRKSFEKDSRLATGALFKQGTTRLVGRFFDQYFPPTDALELLGRCPPTRVCRETLVWPFRHVLHEREFCLLSSAELYSL